MSFEELEKESLNAKDDSLAFISFFESNSDAIEKLDDSNEGEKRFKLKMNGEYGICLANIGTIEKAVNVLAAFIPKFEKESGLTETELVTVPYYEHLLWAFGSSLYHTNKIAQAEQTFERLVKMRPDNQKYKNWLKGTKGKRFSKIRTGLYISIFAWLFIDVLFSKSMDIDLKRFFLLCAAIIFGTTVVLEVYIFLLKRSVR